MSDKKRRITIGILIDWIVSWGDYNYYQSLILSGLSDYARENDLNVMCFITGRVDSPNGWERCRNLLFKFVDRNKVDGLIVPTPSIALYSNMAPVLKLLESYKGIPIVTLGESHEGYSSVTIDNYSGMRGIVDHLIEVHGYRKIAFVKGPPCSETEIRFRAYCDSLEAHNIPYETALVYNGNFLIESGSEAIRSFKQRNIEFDALVCSNDNMAMGAIIEFNQYNDNPLYTLPITGFDDTENGRIYGLTTVRQNFYEETRKAAEMLLNIILGKPAPSHIEIPSNMIIRSSCGCISGMVRNTGYIPDLHTCLCSFEEHRRKTLDELAELNRTLEFAVSADFNETLLAYEAKVFDAFYEEMEQGAADKFVRMVNSLIIWAAQQKVSYIFAEDVVSCIRRNVIQQLKDQADIIRAENLFHAARVHISDSLQTAGINRAYFNPLQNETSEQLGEELMASLDYNSQMKSICRGLPLLGMHTCYIALFEDPLNPLDKSRLILGVNEQECYNKGASGMVFNTTDLLPEVFLDRLYSKRFSIVVQALHQGDNQIGYVILDFGSTINKNHEIIRYRLSVSLKGTMLIESITKQAAELEVLVAERTKELSESNKNLKEEIKKRQAVEEQLKQALKELGYYNEQLHRMSIRDDLTQLYNRRGFMRLGTEYYKNAMENSMGFLLLYVDLDGLKEINDKYGHSEGDFALTSAAAILVKTFRNSDIISRLGGDEFTVIVSGASRKDEADIRRRVGYFCDLHNETSNKPYKLSMSIGAAFYTPGVNLTFEDLMKAADESLYRDKQKKRGLNGNKDEGC